MKRPQRLLILLLCWLSSVTALADVPQRVVSINLCTDQLLLMLADTDQISSVSKLAIEPESSFMAEQALAYPVNHGKTEELLALKPDLIVAGQYSASRMVGMLKELGYRVETFPIVNDLDGIRTSIIRMANLLGKPKRGEQLLKQMEQRLALSALKRPKRKPRAAIYQPNGYTSGSNTLQDIALVLAGWENVAASIGINGYSTIDLESLLLANPQQLFSSAYAPGTQSRAQQQLNHPALKRMTGGREIVNIDYRYWICGGPMITEAVEQLQKSLPQ